MDLSVRRATYQLNPMKIKQDTDKLVPDSKKFIHENAMDLSIKRATSQSNSMKIKQDTDKLVTDSKIMMTSTNTIPDNSHQNARPSLNKKTRESRRMLFPEKLWDLVNRYGSGIQWSHDGISIQVDRSLLQNYLQTKFRSQNFDSFIRQLHFYGFKKSGNSYHHDLFQRGQPELLLSMKRRYSNPPHHHQRANSLETLQLCHSSLPSGTIFTITISPNELN